MNMNKYTDTGYDDETDWEKPTPFDEIDSPPDFPIETLPPTFRNFSKAITEEMQTDIAMPAVNILGAVATAMQGKLKIHVKGTWYEPLNVFLIICAESAERKSPVNKAVTRVLYEYEKKKKSKRIIADDTTLAALSGLLWENNGKISVISTEGNFFTTIAGQYKNGTSIHAVLKAHDDECIKSDRKNRKCEDIENPHLTLLISLQQSELIKLFSNADFRGSGLVARMLVCKPKSKLGNREYDTEPIPKQVYRSYEKSMYRLLNYNEIGDGILELSDKAHSVMADWFDYIESKLKDELAHMTDWAGKLHGATMRIAGILQSMKYYKDLENNLTVSEDTLIKAKTIAEYFLDHAKWAFALTEKNERVKAVEYVLEKIIDYTSEHDTSEISRREIQRLCRDKRYEKINVIKYCFNILEKHGYIKRTEGTAYEVNPYIFDVFDW